MNDEDMTGHTEYDLDGLLAGENPNDPALAGIGAFLHELRCEYRSTPYLPPGPLISDFLGVESPSPLIDDLTVEQQVLDPQRTRTGKLAAAASAALATTMGKIVLGTAVAAATVGGAQAAHVVDLPGIGNRPAISITSTNDGPSSRRSTGVDAEGDGNQGSEVSEFVGTTELEGCEKGEETADLASSGSDAKRKDPGRDDESCEKAGAKNRAGGSDDDSERQDDRGEEVERDGDAAEHDDDDADRDAVDADIPDDSDIRDDDIRDDDIRDDDIRDDDIRDDDGEAEFRRPGVSYDAGQPGRPNDGDPGGRGDEDPEKHGKSDDPGKPDDADQPDD